MVPHDFQDEIDAIGRSKTIPTLLETVLLATGMGFAAVARVTPTRWVTCMAVDNICFGLGPGDELEVESTLCHQVRLDDQEIIIDDVKSDTLYSSHHCPQLYGFRGYISIPIYRADGSFFGTLCAIDPQPRQLSQDRVLSMFRLFAKMIGEVLDADEVLAKSQSALIHEQLLAENQEQFIAILAHDLRNPISALVAGMRMIQKYDIDEDAIKIVGLMRASVNRMGLLIENLLDQARNRIGGGIIIERVPSNDLETSLVQIISELQAVAPDQQIDAVIDLPETVNCDTPRVSQLFSNLLGNAITHGTHGTPIQVEAKLVDNMFSLSVTNEGSPIPDHLLPTLFMPFERGRDRPSREGLGLGLFIASEIAKGHGGNLMVHSDEQQTVFTFQMLNATAL
jgi:signal transduction histidine kinase